MLKIKHNNFLSTSLKTITLFILLISSNLTLANDCSQNAWVNNQAYKTGDMVEYDGNVYTAIYDNPGYNPAKSSWFWKLHTTAQNCNKQTGVDKISQDCGTEWRSANLTYYSSYPDPNDFECRTASECPWMGKFKGVQDKQPESWVKQNNIIAVHSRDYEWLKGKTIKIKQDEKEINATVYDECSDADCKGCCSANLGNENFLIDMEKNTMLRFGNHYGSVQWQICD